MKLSVKSDYATRAVLALARAYPTGESMRVEDLAIEQHIPRNYLVQILIELKAHKIVRSVRGKEGGYLLTRPPVEISFGEVIHAVHGPVFESSALQDSKCPAELRRTWEMLQRSLEEQAGAIHFQKLLEESTEKEKMYYI